MTAYDDRIEIAVAAMVDLLDNQDCRSPFHLGCPVSDLIRAAESDDPRTATLHYPPSGGAVWSEGLTRFAVDAFTAFYERYWSEVTATDLHDLEDGSPPRPIRVRWARFGVCESPVVVKESDFARFGGAK